MLSQVPFSCVNCIAKYQLDFDAGVVLSWQKLCELLLVELIL